MTDDETKKEKIKKGNRIENEHKLSDPKLIPKQHIEKRRARKQLKPKKCITN